MGSSTPSRGHNHAHNHSHGADSCCSIPKEQAFITHLPTSSGSSAVDADVEKGPNTYERVILSIGGIKCTCCENGLSKALRHIPAVGKFQINLVLSRVELDLDVGQLTVAELITRLEKATGFTYIEFERPEGQVLELLVNDPAKFAASSKPFGVISVEPVVVKRSWNPPKLLKENKGTETETSLKTRLFSYITSRMGTGVPKVFFQRSVRIHYDSAQIGARDILEKYQKSSPGQNVQLAPPPPHPSYAAGAQQVRSVVAVFLISLVLTIPVLVFSWAPLSERNYVYHHASLVLATIVQIVAIKEFVPGAFRALIYSRLFEMDFLIALSTTTAYVYSVIAYVFLVSDKDFGMGTFFETSTLLVTLILLGRVVTEFARLRATKSVSFRSLQATEAILFKIDHHGIVETRTIDARLLQPGDMFQVPPHTRIVTDGRVIRGGSEVDESMISGESVPVAKGLGKEVFAGSVNGTGELVVALSALPHENSISKIAEMVENAELSKPKIQALADKIAGWFVPVIVVIGTIVFLVWIFVNRYKRHQVWGSAVTGAITYGISTLIVSCPCAIGLAVPMVILIAGGVAARSGIIFRDPQKLEVARSATDVIFDKTGTLTTGILTIVDTDYHGGGTAPETLILGLLNNIKHPVSEAVVRYLKGKVGPGAKIPKIIDVKSIPGKGVQGICEEDGLPISAGNPDWLGVQIVESPHTVLCVTIDGVLRATFRMKDQVHHNAKSVVKLLMTQGIQVHMISGDNDCTVKDVAHSVGIPRGFVESRCTPGKKQEYIKELQKKNRVVIFCGDGTNDSVALKQADVGVHMSHGSDVAKGASDVVLMSPSVHCIPVMLDISRAAYRRIIFNFVWSFVYNTVAILFAAGAFVEVRLPPQYAGLGELVSVLPVVFIAFSLKWKDFGSKYRNIRME